MRKWLCLLFIGFLFGQIEIEPVGYRCKKIDDNTYELRLNNSRQTLVRLRGKVNDGGEYKRVVWRTDQKYWWSNGMATDEFKVVNPYTYSKNGKVNTMFGPLPEMKGKTVGITASYEGGSDKIYIRLK
tara:strand:- start:676 stop:1059 length:384 start_codon:yes stop_codon:yes gene_type:complete